MAQMVNDISAVRLKTATVAGGDPTSTVYFPAGTAGFEQGHFKCLHASCAHRDDGDFLNAIGIRNDDFEDLTSTEVAEPLPLPAFERDKWGAYRGNHQQRSQSSSTP